MKKIILLCLIIGSGLCIQVALAQQEQKKSIDDVNIIETPFYQEMKFDLMKELKDSFYKNKEEMMSFLRLSQNYTEEEYTKLYNNYEVNPPYVEKNGQLELNPDYISKNTLYIEKNGEYVKNENYVEKPVFEEKKALTATQNASNTSKKRLGKKSFNINPDGFN